MKAVVTGLGRSGTHWLAQWWGIPHEPLGLSRETAYGLRDASVDDVRAWVDRLPNACVDSHLRYAIPQLKQCGVQVLWLWRTVADWTRSMQARVPERSLVACLDEYADAQHLSARADGQLWLHQLAPFGPPPTNATEYPCGSVS